MSLQRFFALALALATASTMSCKARRSHGELSAVDERSALAQMGERYHEAVAPIIRAVARDPGAEGNSFRTTINNSEAEVYANFSEQTPNAETLNKYRLGVVALVKDDHNRDMLVSSVQEELKRRSNILKEVFARDANATKVTPVNSFDVVIVGAGPYGAATAQEIMLTNPQAKVLVVEAGDRPGGTFSKVKAAFLLNSTNRADTGNRAQPGQGNLNSISPLVGLPDISAVKWPEGGLIGDVTTVTLGLTGSGAIFETEVTEISEVRDRSLGTELYIKLTDKANNKNFGVSASKVILATGIGKPLSIFADPNTAASITSEVARIKASSEPNRPASVEDFTTAIERIGQSETPLRPYIGKDTVVVGFGDSAKVQIEFLRRLGPQNAYGRDVAQVGDVGEIYWFAPIETCDEFLNGAEEKGIDGTRGRYSRLFSEIKNGKVKLVPGRVVDARQVNGPKGIQREILYTLNSDTSPQKRIYSSVTDGFQYLDPKATSVVGAIRADKKAVDHVITTTGFESKIVDVLKPLMTDDVVADPKKIGTRFQKLEGEVRGFDKPVDYTAQLKDRSNNPKPVYLVGPANEIVGGLPRKEELARVNANTVSLFANIERAKAAARLVATASALRFLQPMVEVVATPGDKISFKELDRGGKYQVVIPKNEIQGDFKSKGNLELDLKVELNKILRRVQVNADQNVELRFEATAEGLVVNLNGTGAAAEQFVQSKIRNNPKLKSVVASYFARGTRTKAIAVVVPAWGNSIDRLNTARMEIRPESGRVANSGGFDGLIGATATKDFRYLTKSLVDFLAPNAQQLGVSGTIIETETRLRIYDFTPEQVKEIQRRVPTDNTNNNNFSRTALLQLNSYLGGEISRQNIPIQAAYRDGATIARVLETLRQEVGRVTANNTGVNAILVDAINSAKAFEFIENNTSAKANAEQLYFEISEAERAVQRSQVDSSRLTIIRDRINSLARTSLVRPRTVR